MTGANATISTLLSQDLGVLSAVIIVRKVLMRRFVSMKVMGTYTLILMAAIASVTSAISAGSFSE
jgi:hypothetical protein